MNQIAYFKIFIFSLLLLAFPLEAKLLKPSQDGEKKEILIINGKRRGSMIIGLPKTNLILENGFGSRNLSQLLKDQYFQLII